MAAHSRSIPLGLALSVALAAGCNAPAATSAPAAASPPGPVDSSGTIAQPSGLPDFKAIRDCLTAAGIDVPFPSGVGSAGGSLPPRPSGSFSPPPELIRLFSDPSVRAALAACGITLSPPSHQP
jgi:hypothetical protein